MQNRHILLFSFLLFCIGLLLINNAIELQIVNFINQSFHLHLDLFFRSQGLLYCGGLLITLSLMGVLLFLVENNFISQKQFYLFSSGTLVLFYFCFLWKDAFNMPVTDDYKILFFLEQYPKEITFSQKWQLIAQPVFECRMILPRLYFLSVMKIFGSLNFKWLIMANGLILLAFCNVLFSFFHHPKKDTLQLAFLFLLLQFQSFDASFWSSSGICHYTAFLFVLLSIRMLLGRSRYASLKSFLFALLASFTFGNGLFVFPVCLVLLLIKGKIKQAVIFALFVMLMFIAYFYAWPYPTLVPEFNLPANIIYVPGFIGSSMQFFYTLYIPVLAGLFCLSIYIYATVKKYYHQNPGVWAVLLFIIITACMAAPFRRGWSPLQSRYGLYSITAIIASLITILDMLSKKQADKRRYPVFNFQFSIFRLILISAICYNFLSGIMFYPEAPVRKLKLETFISNWINGRPVTYYPNSIPKEADKFLNDAKRSGVWTGE